MKRVSLLLAALAAMFTAASAVSPAQAVNLNHTWVAGNGDDTSATCDRSAPCATFANAYGKTAVGGEISCVDGGNYLGVNISHSITITCDSAIAGVAGLAFPISLSSATDIVVLRGLDLDGLGASPTGPAGLIDFTDRGTLILENIKIRNLAGTWSGVYFRPNAAASLYVADSSITNVGTSGSTAGINVKPNSSVQANVTIVRTLLENNLFGIIADGTGGGTIRGNVTDSVMSGNKGSGMTALSSSASVVMVIKRSTISSNAYGLIAAGGGGVMLVSDSTITNNATGLFIAGGAITSYGNNELNANTTTDGAFNFTISRQ